MSSEIEHVRTITTAELAEILKVSVQTVRTMRRTGRGPRWVVTGGHVRYYYPDVEAWLRGETPDREEVRDGDV